MVVPPTSQFEAATGSVVAITRDKRNNARLMGHLVRERVRINAAQRVLFIWCRQFVAHSTNLCVGREICLASCLCVNDLLDEWISDTGSGCGTVDVAGTLKRASHLNHVSGWVVAHTYID